ncbi:MAG: CPBP family intramembrane glutamic endopeptidase [Planctomycetota bacterium]
MSPVPRAGAALDLLLLLTVTLILPLGQALASELLDPNAGLAGFSPLLAVGKWFDALLLIVLAAYFRRRNALPASAFGLQTDHLGRQVLWSVPMLAAIYVALIPMIVIVSVLLYLVPQVTQDLEHRLRFVELLPLGRLSDTLLLLIPVAIHEELLFRGLLIPYLRRVGLGWLGAIFASSAVFAVLHVTQGWLAILQVFGIGLVLSGCFVLSRSLLAVMLAHFFFDFIQMQILPFLVRWLEQLLPGQAP